LNCGRGVGFYYCLIEKYVIKPTAVQFAVVKRVFSPAFLFLYGYYFLEIYPMSGKAISVVNKVANLIEPILDDMGFELIDVVYLSRYGKWVLRLYIDKEGGVSIDDCANVSRELGDLIDIHEIINHDYVFEVSSPGVNRPLKNERDYKNVIGKKIKVKTIDPILGRRNFTGYLKDFKDQTLFILEGEELINLKLPYIDKANLVYEFND
jgi:ribosome maturation factor RimP